MPDVDPTSSGWDLEVVRQCAYKLVAQYNDYGQLTVLDDGREHRHRIALCTDSKNVEHVVSSLKARFIKAGLQVGGVCGIHGIVSTCCEFPGTSGLAITVLRVGIWQLHCDEAETINHQYSIGQIVFSDPRVRSFLL